MWLKHSHHFARRHALYPMLLSTCFACILFVGRVYLSRSWVYIFMVWNLLLAWIPFLASLGAVYFYGRQPRRWWYLLIPTSLVWLAFFPNAPYLVTDLMHLRPRQEIPFWYDLALLAVFAWTGVFLAVFSLRAMQSIIKTLAGTFISWFFVVSVVGLSGLGVYMGRFLRWNSWDLVIRPRDVLVDIGTRLVDPLQHPGTFGVSLIFALFLMICYLTIAAGPLPEQS